jgi:hypothetical protein
MPENRFVGEIARTYDHPGTGMFADDVLEATVDCLVELTGGGAAMAFAIATRGRGSRESAGYLEGMILRFVDFLHTVRVPGWGRGAP